MTAASILSELGRPSPDFDRCCHSDDDGTTQCPAPEEYVAVVITAVGADGTGAHGEPWELGACAEHLALLREENPRNIVSVRSVRRG